MVITKVIARKKTFLIFFSDVDLFLIGGGGGGFPESKLGFGQWGKVGFN